MMQQTIFFFFKKFAIQTLIVYELCIRAIQMEKLLQKFGLQQLQTYLVYFSKSDHFKDQQ